MTKIETNVEYGKVYKDSVTGFTGVATSITKWQFGCIRVCLIPKVGKDGKLPEGQWFDEESLEGIVAVSKATGGPTLNPKMNADPKY